MNINNLATDYSLQSEQAFNEANTISIITNQLNSLTRETAEKDKYIAFLEARHKQHEDIILQKNARIEYLEKMLELSERFAALNGLL